MSQLDSRGPSDDNVTVLSRKTEIRGGTLSVAHDLTVRGVVEGEVRVGGKVVVAAGAEVQGTLHAREAVVAGRVRGELTVAETLTLRSSAVVDGTATATRLVVEEGSSGSVRLKVGGKEFLDVLETRRREARAELDRVRAKAQKPNGEPANSTSAVHGTPRASGNAESTEKLLESKEMKEFLESESAHATPSSSKLPDEVSRSEKPL